MEKRPTNGHVAYRKVGEHLHKPTDLEGLSTERAASGVAATYERRNKGRYSTNRSEPRERSMLMKSAFGSLPTTIIVVPLYIANNNRAASYCGSHI